jgi:hypothetical protein
VWHRSAYLPASFDSSLVLFESESTSVVVMHTLHTLCTVADVSAGESGNHRCSCGVPGIGIGVTAADLSLATHASLVLAYLLACYVSLSNKEVSGL